MNKKQKSYYELIKGLAFGILAMVGACWFVLHYAGNPFQEIALIQRGETTTGNLVDSFEIETAGSHDRIGVCDRGVYSYRLSDGREFKTFTDVPTGQLKELEKVEYLPDNPAVSRIKGDGCQTITEFLWRKVGLGGILFVAFLSIGFTVIRKAINEFKRSKVPSSDE